MKQKYRPVGKAEQDILRLAKAPGIDQGRFVTPLIKAATGDCSPRTAIRAKCIECCGLEDVVNRIESCSVYSCPLHAFRPYQNMERV